jgi:hypothetical protein
MGPWYLAWYLAHASFFTCFTCRLLGHAGLAAVRCDLITILSVSALYRIGFAAFARGFYGAKRLILDVKMDGKE